MKSTKSDKWTAGSIEEQIEHIQRHVFDHLPTLDGVDREDVAQQAACYYLELLQCGADEPSLLKYPNRVLNRIQSWLLDQQLENDRFTRLDLQKEYLSFMRLREDAIDTFYRALDGVLESLLQMGADPAPVIAFRTLHSSQLHFRYKSWIEKGYYRGALTKIDYQVLSMVRSYLARYGKEPPAIALELACERLEDLGLDIALF